MSKAEKRRNCVSCNKSLKRVDWYYRNNEYFCSKGCFQKKTNKKGKEAA